MDLVFLEAAVPLTKQFTQTKSGLTKTPYPFVWEFTSHQESVQTLAQFESILRLHAGRGHCLLKGSIARDLVKESRAGSTDTNAPTEWVCLDFDGVDSFKTVDETLKALGLKDISHIVQFSASAGISDSSLRAHVFFLLDKPVSAPLLKQWLIHLNHSVPELRAGMHLTKTGNSISWPLDISACQNDKLIYIAPPVLNGIPDPFKGKQRIALNKRKTDRLSISGLFSTEKNRDLTQKRITELREAEGLPKRSFKTKMHGTAEILVKPDACTITEIKQERGFVYFNLNGGDSWAYYHPESNPEFIFNFKGEPTYLTKELLPDYWQQLTSQATKTDSKGITYLAFCDRQSSAYWRGTYDANEDRLDISKAKNETQLRHFAKQHGLPLGDFIPEWDLVFNPKDNVRVDTNARIINQFVPSEYMKVSATRPAKQNLTIPKTILKVMNHALGGDTDILEHFINWLAYILQERDMTATAWVLHGTEGTGKGVIASKILRPIFGAQHTALRRMEELNEQYNHFMRNALIVVVDEVQTSSLNNERGVMAKLRNFISESTVTLREMRENGYDIRNFTNWLFFSNMADPVAIPKADRRFNVAKYQPAKLNLTDKEIDRIETELQDFHDYLLYYPCDRNKARTVLDTADRQTMISISESSVDTVSSKLLDGDFEWFMDQLPATTAYSQNASAMYRLENYKHTLRALLERTVSKTQTCAISREELRVIFEFVVGSMPETPNKFTTYMKHHRIHMDKVWVNEKTVNGIRVTWKQNDEQRALMLEALSPQSSAKVTPISKGKSAKQAKKA